MCVFFLLLFNALRGLLHPVEPAIVDRSLLLASETYHASSLMTSKR